MPKLGKTQKAVYEFICIYIEENFIPPTVREIGAAVGLKSTSTVHMHLQNLAAKGLIILTPSKQRSITLPKSVAPASAMSPGMNIPLVGSVAAGQPILAGRKHPGLSFRPRVIFGAAVGPARYLH